MGILGYQDVEAGLQGWRRGNDGGSATEEVKPGAARGCCRRLVTWTHWRLDGLRDFYGIVRLENEMRSGPFQLDGIGV